MSFVFAGRLFDMSIIRCEKNTCTGRHGYSEGKVCKHHLAYQRSGFLSVKRSL